MHRLNRQPELAALLDAETAFPAGPFSGEEALAALQRLGLRCQLSPSALLDAARFVAALARRDPDAAHARCACSGPPATCVRMRQSSWCMNGWLLRCESTSMAAREPFSEWEWAIMHLRLPALHSLGWIPVRF